MLMRGQSLPPGKAGGSAGVSMVHGQPLCPEGGGGSALRLGQRIAYHNVHALHVNRRPMPLLPARARRPLQRARGAWRRGHAGAAAAGSRVLQMARLGGVAAGLLPPEIAVLESRGGRHASGFFSEFAAVVGMLDHYHRWRPRYAGIRINFGEGLYYDAAVGPNWWQYYFETIDEGGGSGAPVRVVSPHYHDWCAHRVERRLPREAAAALIDRYIRVRPGIRQLVDRFVREQWLDRFVIGVHYRGTDKAEDAPRVPYERVDTAVREAIGRAGTADWQLFVATDEQAFLDFMRSRFAGRLLFREMFRSVDGRPIDVVNPDGNYKKGEDALVDCLLLARTHHLIRTASNLSLCSTLFNAGLPATLLNRER